MKKILYTADGHWAHRNIIKYENRPYRSTDEMDKDLILKWNNKVSPGDDVYYLGDMFFCEEDYALNILKQLNGNIHLIWGNHDKVIKKSRSLQSKFIWCRDYHVNYDQVNGQEIPVILFHYPIQVWDRKHHGSIHLYGHIHSDQENHHPLVAALPNAYNVGVDVCNFEPKTLSELIK